MSGPTGPTGPNTPSGESWDQQPPLALARLALERGDYGQVIRMLTPFSGPGTGQGADASEVLLLLATAWMGLGDNAEALACCRRLRACGDATIRGQATELQRVLEAPSLQRPREWSLTLPDLPGSNAAMGRQLGELSRRRRIKPPPPPPPAVGPTRAPLGFALVVVALVLLGLLLGGCGQVHTELRFSGPGRMQVRHHLISAGAGIPPWQRQFAAQLHREGFDELRLGREQVLESKVLPSRQALHKLGQSLEIAAALGNLNLPTPELGLRSRNWLVGVQDNLDLRIDLTGLGPWPGLDLGLLLDQINPDAVQRAEPKAVVPAPAEGLAQRRERELLWPLQSGVTNRLVLHTWRWSPLGLGTLVVASLLGLSLTLQGLRRRLGFGLPELPG